MALIVLLVINLLINFNYIQAVPNNDTNAENSPIAWIRDWCPYCDMFINRLKSAVEAFSKIISDGVTENSTAPRDEPTARIGKPQSAAENYVSQTNKRILSDPGADIKTVYYKVGDETFAIDEKAPNPPNPTKVYMADLESTVYHIVHNDFIRISPLNSIATNYLWFIRYFFPDENARVKKFTQELHEYLFLTQQDHANVTRTELRTKLLELGKKYPLTPKRWISCRGHENTLNCGLWLLFHTLCTAWSVHKNSNPILYYQILQQFVDYYHPDDIFADKIGKFDNFVKNYFSNTTLELTTALWTFHNEVRARLGKPFFPSTYECPECYPEGSNNYDNNRIFFFLIKMYTKIYTREAEIDERTR